MANRPRLLRCGLLLTVLAACHLVSSSLSAHRAERALVTIKAEAVVITPEPALPLTVVRVQTPVCVVSPQHADDGLRRVAANHRVRRPHAVAARLQSESLRWWRPAR